MKFLSIFAVLMAALPAFATRVGNGGFVINCGGKVELFDYYLAEQKGLHISSALGNAGTPAVSYNASWFLKRLAPLDPNRYANFAALIKEYESSPGYQMIPGNSLVLDATQAADPDYQEKFGLGSIQIPPQCKLILAIMQEDPAETHQNQNILRLKIMSEVWNNLDLATQTGLLLHELFYFEHIRQQLPPFDSSGVRELNGWIASDEFISLNAKNWTETLKKNHFVPMFPNFHLPNMESYPAIFGVIPSKTPSDYTVNSMRELIGQTEVCGRSYDTKTSAATFFDGFFPSSSEIQTDVSSMDLSCISKDELFMSLTARCPIYYGRIKPDGAPVVTGAGADPGTNAYCIGSLQKYTNPNVQSTGPVYAQVLYTMSSYQLYLRPSDFGILKVQWKGMLTNVKNQAVINLDTGVVLSAY